MSKMMMTLAVAVTLSPLPASGQNPHLAKPPQAHPTSEPPRCRTKITYHPGQVQPNHVVTFSAVIAARGLAEAPKNSNTSSDTGSAPMEASSEASPMGAAAPGTLGPPKVGSGQSVLAAASQQATVLSSGKGLFSGRGAQLQARTRSGFPALLRPRAPLATAGSSTHAPANPSAPVVQAEGAAAALLPKPDARASTSRGKRLLFVSQSPEAAAQSDAAEDPDEPDAACASGAVHVRCLAGFHRTPACRCIRNSNEAARLRSAGSFRTFDRFAAGLEKNPLRSLAANDD